MIYKRVAIAVALVVAALLSAPASADAEADLERGLARFQAGDYAAAIPPLAAAHAAAPSDLDTALLLGISYFHCHDPARARPLLIAAERSPEPETRDSARIFLGLIADAAGDSASAMGYYDHVARGNSSLATSGQELRDRGSGGQFAAGLVIRPELDSNVPLMPATATPIRGGTGDGDLFVLAHLSLRPFDDVPLVLEEIATYRKQAQLTDYDMAVSVTGATWSYRDELYRAALGYHLDVSTLGGARYQLGHTFDAGARRAISGAFGLAASYQFVLRTLFPDAFAGYSGTVQTGAARLSWLTPGWELELGPMIAREITDDPTLRVLASGGQFAVRLRQGRTDLRLFGRVTDRRYDDAALGRRDLQVRADASMYIELTPNLGAVLGATLLDDRSNVMDESYVKWTGYLGIVIASEP